MNSSYDKSPPRQLCSFAALALLAGFAVPTYAGSSSAKASSNPALESRLLSVTDLPAGWSARHTAAGGGESTVRSCLSGLDIRAKGWTHASAEFVQGPSVPSLNEYLATGPRNDQVWESLNSSLARCTKVSFALGSLKASGTFGTLSFPRIVVPHAAYALDFKIGGIPFGLDLVLFDADNRLGEVTYSDMGSPDVTTVVKYVNAAVAKLTGATGRVTGIVSVVSARVQIAHTKLGNVAYRVVGSGHPLVLIAGYASTMEIWDRRFVDALAERYRVVIFDNAGIGDTHSLPSPLTIDAMANQTSALITALGLGRPNVLGWSMGSMVADALAVLHPAQVRDLVLCAAYPGTGTNKPSQKAIQALKSGNSKEVLAALFPANQTVAGDEYFLAESSYPPSPSVPQAISAEQSHAIDDWWDGNDAVGKRTAAISAPTLVADGTEDQLDPVLNDRAVASQIQGAKLVLYSDAGHAFLFQDESAFVPTIESFLK
jgi:pimeloyl-ACP methyl ester carboxylesterase